MPTETPVTHSAPPKFRRWTFAVHLTLQPSCPRCTKPLKPNATSIVHGLAVCDPCAIGDRIDDTLAARVRRSPEVCTLARNARGILFYVPLSRPIHPLHEYLPGDTMPGQDQVEGPLPKPRKLPKRNSPPRARQTKGRLTTSSRAHDLQAPEPLKS